MEDQTSPTDPIKRCAERQSRSKLKSVCAVEVWRRWRSGLAVEFSRRESLGDWSLEPRSESSEGHSELGAQPACHVAQNCGTFGESWREVASQRQNGPS